MAFRLQARQEFPCVLMVSFLQSLGSAFQPGPKLGSVKKFDGLIALCFVKTLPEVASIGKAMPRLFRLPLVPYATNRLIPFAIEFRCRRGHLIPKGVDNLLFIRP